MLLVCFHLELAGDNFKQWRLHNHANKFDLNHKLVKDNVERIDVNQVSPELFVEKYEKLYKPVVIRGATDKWKANTKWTTTVSNVLATSFF